MKIKRELKFCLFLQTQIECSYHDGITLEIMSLTTKYMSE